MEWTYEWTTQVEYKYRIYSMYRNNREGKTNPKNNILTGKKTNKQINQNFFFFFSIFVILYIFFFNSFIWFLKLLWGWLINTHKHIMQLQPIIEDKCGYQPHRILLNLTPDKNINSEKWLNNVLGFFFLFLHLMPTFLKFSLYNMCTWGKGGTQ